MTIKEIAQTMEDAIAEIERLRAVVFQFHEDFKLMHMVAMYGNPPGGWSDTARIVAFRDAVTAAEIRHRLFDDPTDLPNRTAQ